MEPQLIEAVSSVLQFANLLKCYFTKIQVCILQREKKEKAALESDLKNFYYFVGVFRILAFRKYLHKFNAFWQTLNDSA